jgi:hypothetical protein
METNKPPEEEEGIPWHTAFFEAIQMVTKKDTPLRGVNRKNPTCYRAQ